MGRVTFKHPNQSRVLPKLFIAVCKVYEDFGRYGTCVSGYRDLETQKATNALVLTQHKGAYMTPDGAVYTGTGANRLCWASAYGDSPHNYCYAMDMDEWFEKLTNAQLKPYGLIKPLAHEPWHVVTLECTNLSQKQREAIRDAVLKGVTKDMDIKDFQVLTGLTADGIKGPKTDAKLIEMLKFCQKQLGNDFQNAFQAIAASQGDPTYWIDKIKKGDIKYLEPFTMNLVKRMGGEF